MIDDVRKLSLDEFNGKKTEDIVECTSPKTPPGLIIREMSTFYMFKEANSYIGENYPNDRLGVRLLVAACMTKGYVTERDMENVLEDLLASQPSTSTWSAPSQPTENVENSLEKMKLSPEDQGNIIRFT